MSNREKPKLNKRRSYPAASREAWPEEIALIQGCKIKGVGTMPTIDVGRMGARKICET